MAVAERRFQSDPDVLMDAGINRLKRSGYYMYQQV